MIWFFIAWLANRRIISAVTGARAIDRRADPRLWNLLENLCISRGVTMPKLQIIETGARNAFASGVRESQYTVTVTRGLMDTLDDKELEAVLAHELTHIENRDVQLLVVAAIFVGIISFSAHLMMRSPRILVRSGRRGGGSSGGKGAGFLILIAIAIFVIAWVLAIALRFAISCKREYLADAGAVELTKNPDAMIGALLKIAGHSEIEVPEEIQAMLLDHQREGRFARMFASHPSIKDPRRGAYALRRWDRARRVKGPSRGQLTKTPYYDNCTVMNPSPRLKPIPLSSQRSGDCRLYSPKSVKFSAPPPALASRCARSSSTSLTKVPPLFQLLPRPKYVAAAYPNRRQ